ncbi:hypothetical protein QBC38DRAFT_463457 [Podospora fimiseda]|uniref:ATP-dependent bile acid permease n=1 Tax=Podospora fimiseda TaxID=252190 RepID=A0AAN7H8D3_9PEZI|nr:hypothetical protein QBC38DRAFT_463457 [Podospora fimiseda]
MLLDPAQLSTPISYATAALIALLSIPTFVQLATREALHPRFYDLTWFEDRDGNSKEESIKEFSHFRPRLYVGLALVVGIVALWIEIFLDSPFAESYKPPFLELACWFFLGLQLGGLPKKPLLPYRFYLVILNLISSLLFASCLAFLHGYTAIESLFSADLDRKQRVFGLLHLVQIISPIGAAIAYATFPRRPDVYHGDLLVDQQHTLSLLRLFTFSWNRVVFTIAKERQMELDDIPELDYQTRSKTLKARFLESRDEKAPLWRQLVKNYLWELAVQWALTGAVAVLAVFPQVVLYNFLSRIEHNHGSTSTDPMVFVWVFGLLLSQILQVGINNWIKWITASRLEIPVSCLLQSLVFSKALRQYETAAPGQEEDGNKKEDQSGDENGSMDAKKDDEEPETRQNIINHMKLDSNRVTMFCTYNNNFPLAIFKLILAGAFCISLMGWLPVVGGFLAASLTIPASHFLSKKYTALHFSLMKYRDGKAHLLTEALQGMRQIRYSALEQHWEDKILASRNAELRQYWKVMIWSCLVVLSMNLGPLLLSGIAFSTYVWQNGSDVRASVIFTALGLFDQLDEAIALLPLLQTYLIEAWTSCVRLQKYFNQIDKEQFAQPGESITFDNATVAWPRVQDTELADSAMESDAGSCRSRGAHSMLRNVTLHFPTGKLTVISGQTGSGKSLLLAAILGEVKLLDGHITMPTPPVIDENAASIPPSEWIIPQLVAFVSQNPWIESGTVKENVLFGLPFVKDRYRKVLAACALEKDIELLVDGDETEVGPKGVTLSGGQRWRTALARALYSRAGILVLDDVLSAVDAHVGRLIVEQALTGDLANGRTRILATHHAELVLPYASYSVQLHSGEVEAVKHLTPAPEKYTEGSDVEDLAIASQMDGSQEEEQNTGSAVSGKKRKSAEKVESRQTGRVKWKVYLAYYKASGGALSWVFVIGVMLLGHFVTISRNWSLKELAQHASSEALRFTLQSVSSKHFPSYPSHSDDPGSGSGQDQWKWGEGVYFWLAVYVGFEVLTLLVFVIRVVLNFCVGMKAAKQLFQRMTHAILRAPLRWIDTIPSGRILNRFTSDTFMIDRRLASQAFNFLRSTLFLIVIISTSLSVSVYVILFGVFLLFFYVRVACEYIDVAREVKRINSVSNSPIYDQFSSVLTGLSTVRAFDRTNFYMNRMYSLIDASTKASWALSVISRWMAVRMGVLGALFVSVVANAVAFSQVSAAMAGFSLAFAMRYTSALTSLLSAMSSLELGFNACERVLEYAQIDREPEDGEDASAAWPTQGRIEVENLTISYAPDLPPVLKNLNFTIGAGERIGIIGRTGAGKSTLAAVLFRLLEPLEGSVRIDNVDIATLKLSHLRSRLAIIPQDPFLFSGTLRSNLDMEGVLEDYDMLAALRRVHLIPQLEDSPNYPTPSSSVVTECSIISAIASDAETDVLTALDVEPTTVIEERLEVGSAFADDYINIFTNLSTPISTGGANLSQGQRQLVCLARALLKRPKIVVLDEATSAVDRGTDSNIQESLRKEFAAAGCTVLVIAHRLSTVADFDRLLVLEKGEVAEIGNPKELLEAGIRRETAKLLKTQTDDTDGQTGGAGDEDMTSEDGAGAFWDLVQKSAEKEKLFQMVLGKGEDEVLAEINGQ